MDDSIFALEGNGTRPSHRGSGISEPNGNMFTLNTTEVHGVMYPTYGIDQQGGKGNASFTENVMPTILSDSHGTPHAVCYPCLMDQGGQFMKIENDISGTLRSEIGGHAPVVLENVAIPIDRRNECREKSSSSGIGVNGEPMFTLTTPGGGIGIPLVFTDNESILYYNHPQGSDVTEEKTNICQTLTQKMGTGGGNVPLVREPIFYDSHPMDSRVTPCNKNCQTLSTRFGGENDPNTILIREEKMNENTHYVVRRITPKECERLQSFPDDWTNIPWPKGQCPDSHRYKALGNSMNCMVMFRIGQAIQFALDNPITEDKSEKIAYQTSLFDF